MMDNWKKVFYNDKRTKENYKFPKKLNKDSEYYSAVLQFMDILIKDLRDNGIEKAFIEIAVEYRELFKDVLANYYSGNIVLVSFCKLNKASFFRLNKAFKDMKYRFRAKYLQKYRHVV